MPTTGYPILDVLLALAAAGSGVAALWRWVIRQPARAAWRTGKWIVEFLEDWRGSEPRPGVPGRAGVMARLEGLEEHTDRLTVRTVRIEQLVDAQLTENGGTSMHDRLAEVHQRVTSDSDQ